MTKNDIVVYSTHTCSFCHGLMAWLDSNKVEYTTKYVDTDMPAQEELIKKLNGEFHGVPVTIINDKDIIVGFDREEIIKVLKPLGLEIKADRFIFD